MKKLTREELNKILEDHKHWIKEDCDNWENMRAYLRGADLSCADLSRADLSGADLRDADLRGAYLRDADLSCADLSRADLRGAYLRDADLSRAYLRDADLSCADLIRADLSGADLSRAYLSGADLSGAYLSGAYLSGAYLRDADLRGADLSGAKNIPYVPMACPEEDSFIGWKKASNRIVKLEIPSDAKRSSSTGRKCRCNKAKVLAIFNLDGTPAGEEKVESSYDNKFIYKIGETIAVDNFDDNRWEECAPGIHFFINRQEAINYN